MIFWGLSMDFQFGAAIAHIAYWFNDHPLLDEENCKLQSLQTFEIDNYHHKDEDKDKRFITYIGKYKSILCKFTTVCSSNCLR